jgi:hypothetical protein
MMTSYQISGRVITGKAASAVSVLLPLLMTMLLLSCGGENRQDSDSRAAADSASTTSSWVSADRVLVDTLRVDFFGDGSPLMAVASRLLEDSVMRAGYFDRIEIFPGIPGSRPLFTDVLEYGVRWTVRDITGDSLPECIVEVDAGGNAPMTSSGLHVYGKTAKGKITLIFFSPGGAPVLNDLDGDGSDEILVSDQYWGMMPHSEAVGFTKDIYAFDGARYVRANERFGAWFDRQLASCRKATTVLRVKSARGEDVRDALYTSTVELLLWTWARGGSQAVQQLWRKESRELRSLLPEEYLDDLQAFVEDVEVMRRQQKEQRR